MSKFTEGVGKAVGTAKEAAGALAGYKGVFRTLKKEHGEVAAMLMQVSQSNDPEVRRDVFTRIREELLSHAKAEDREFYPVLQRFEETRDLATHSLDEHTEIEQMIDDLSARDVTDPTWGETFERLKTTVQQHVDEEENQLFARAKDVVSDELANELDERFTTEKNRVRDSLQHPH